MKLVLIFLLAVAACAGGEMIRTSNVDFKRPDDDRVAQLAKLRSTLDLTNAKDQEVLERFEQDCYFAALMDVIRGNSRDTRLKSGDDWRALWHDRKAKALSETGDDQSSRATLSAAFTHLQRFENSQDALVLERVVKAKFGGEDAWVFIVHWEREEWVRKSLDAGKETELGHILFIGVRCSDQKLVARIRCG